METVRRLYIRSWRGLVLGLSLAAITWLLYFRRLGDLLPGYSTPELATYRASDSWRTIAHNPINAPYKLFTWLLTAIFHHSILADRAIAAALGLVMVLLFFVVVRAWCTYRVAYISTVMFATSSGLLHFARLGTADILQMSGLALLAVVLWYRGQREHRALIAYLLVALFAALWYVPGMIWFEALGIVLLKGTIRGQLRRRSTLNLAGPLLLLILILAPLALASISNPQLLLEAAGLPQQLHVLSLFGSNLWNLVLDIGIRSSGGSPLLWVGHAPLLDAAEAIAALLGAIYVVRARSVRSTFLLGSTVIGLILASLTGGVTFVCLVPVLYLFAATGLDHLLSRWLAVFPRNPIARLCGIGVVCMMVAFSVLYQVRTYYVAWPHDPATRAVFDHPAP